MQQGAFARAGSADYGHHFARSNMQADVTQHFDGGAAFTVSLAQMVSTQDIGSGRILNHVAIPVRVAGPKPASWDTRWLIGKESRTWRPPLQCHSSVARKAVG